MAETPERAQNPATILVVEDSATQLEALRYLLEEAGFQVVAATNGREGLTAARANAIDLVISDVVMPHLDGYALCRALRGEEALWDLPVILLTFLSDPHDLIRGLESGANHFVRKPYADRALLARVRNVLANQEIRRAVPHAPGISILFAGQRFFITADRMQILDMLLSTYESAVNDNTELLRARDELRALNEQLEARVADRTKALAAEVTERRQAVEALRKNEEKYRVLFESSRDALTTLEPPSWRFASGNAAAVEMFRARDEADFTSRAPWEYSPERQPDGRPSADKARGYIETAMAKGSLLFDWTHQGLDGVSFPTIVLLTRMEIGEQAMLQSSVRDVTERRQAEEVRAKLEEQLRASQKMEAIGSLAGGVAHDFNNLLSVILGYTSFAIEGLPEGDPVRQDLLEVKKAGERASAVTRQLLAFGRRQVLQPVPLDLNQVSEGVEKMLRRILGEDITLVQTLAPDLWLTLADPGQIEQVLVNLVVNARDAMPEGGRLTIETSNVEIDEDYAARQVGVKPGSYVGLAVTDTGCGMDQQTRERIFEPFFTTKEAGKGTGLGLSTAYGIIKQSQGSIWVYSEPGHGTTFRIYLPREFPATAAPATVLPTVPTHATGTETILVTEDEEALRNVARRTLEAAGYTVLVARDGDEALRISSQHVGDIHLLLTDMVMPGMGGRMLARILSGRRPTTRVLYMSGYADDAIAHHGALAAGTHFLSKPFTAADLRRKVREALDAGVPDVQDRYAPATGTGAEPTERPLDREALRALPGDLLDRLLKAVTAARYDELVELVETVRRTDPDLATSLRRMADLFDYDGMRNLLGE